MIRKNRGIEKIEDDNRGDGCREEWGKKGVWKEELSKKKARIGWEAMEAKDKEVWLGNIEKWK